MVVSYGQDMNECILIIIHRFRFHSHHQILPLLHRLLWCVMCINQQGEFHHWYFIYNLCMTQSGMSSIYVYDGQV